MALILYADNSDTITVKLDESEAIWVGRIMANSQTAQFRELVTDWIRIKANELAKSDLDTIKARLETATAVELATVMLALKIQPGSVPNPAGKGRP